jgi:hypothetical protein
LVYTNGNVIIAVPAIAGVVAEAPSGSADTVTGEWVVIVNIAVGVPAGKFQRGDQVFLWLLISVKLK